MLLIFCMYFVKFDEPDQKLTINRVFNTWNVIKFVIDKKYKQIIQILDNFYGFYFALN